MVPSLISNGHIKSPPFPPVTRKLDLVLDDQLLVAGKQTFAWCLDRSCWVVAYLVLGAVRLRNQFSHILRNPVWTDDISL